MEFPLKVIIESIEDFCILHFKEINHPPNSPPHFYIPISANFLICKITSQIQSRERYYARTKAKAKALKSLILINKNIFGFLSKESIIDCNQATILSKEELIKIIDPKHGCEMKERNISYNLKKDIISAINQSPIIPDYIKKIVNSIYGKKGGN